MSRFTTETVYWMSGPFRRPLIQYMEVAMSRSIMIPAALLLSAVAGARAITAFGASRPTSNPSPLSFNSASLELHGTQFSSVTADFFLAGARSLVAGTYPDAGNSLRVLARGVTGSGVRSNVYASTLGPAVTTLGADNSLEFIGSLQAFSHTNSNIEPPPPAEFFTAFN